MNFDAPRIAERDRKNREYDDEEELEESYQAELDRLEEEAVAEPGPGEAWCQNQRHDPHCYEVAQSTAVTQELYCSALCEHEANGKEIGDYRSLVRRNAQRRMK